MKLRWETLVWAVLSATMLAVAVRFATEPRKAPPGVEPLPVLRQLGPFALTNQLGRPVGLESTTGHINVFNVIFSRCPTQCHRLSEQMSRLQSSLPADARLWSLTADPDFDTPQVLERYGRRYGGDANRWQFLTGTKREVYRFAMQDLQFSVMENPEPSKAKLEDLFIHSTVFVIVDRHNRMRAVVQGELPDAPARIATVVRQLASE